MITILITGGLGFIGSHFIEQSYKKYGNKIRIINVDKDTLHRSNHKHLKHIQQIHNKQNYIFYKLNICNTKKIYNILLEYKPEIIIHFAAESHVDSSIEFPQKHTKTNIIGTNSLLIASSKYYNMILNNQQKQRFRFHFISTDEVFGDLSIDSNEKFNEETKFNPSSPYSATKAGAQHLVRAWNKTYNLPYSISNCSNNYGKYQDQSKLIPKVINACINNKIITVHGTGKYIRDWIAVEDHCNAIQLIMENLDKTKNKTYLIGSGLQLTNLQVIDYICEIFDKLKPLSNNKSYKDNKVFVQNRAGQDLRYSINSDKIIRELNWSVKIDFYKKIQELIHGNI